MMSTTPSHLSPLTLRQEGGPPAGGLLWGDGKGAGGEVLEGGREAGAGPGVGGGWLPHLQGAGGGDRQPWPGDTPLQPRGGGPRPLPPEGGRGHREGAMPSLHSLFHFHLSQACQGTGAGCDCSSPFPCCPGATTQSSPPGVTTTDPASGEAAAATVTTPKAGLSTLLMHTQCQHCQQQIHTIRAPKTHIQEDNCQRETSSDENPAVTFFSQKSSDCGDIKRGNGVKVYLI